MKPKDLMPGTTYMGPRSSRVGRARLRRLDRIVPHARFADTAYFTEMSDPIRKGERDRGTIGNMTVKSFAQWAVRPFPDNVVR